MLTAAEREQLAAARQQEHELVARINAAANRLATLYRTRRLGLGRDPTWSARVAACERKLDDLYAALRAARAKRRDLLWEADRRLQEARRAAGRAQGRMR